MRCQLWCKGTGHALSPLPMLQQIIFIFITGAVAAKESFSLIPNSCLMRDMSLFNWCLSMCKRRLVSLHLVLLTCGRSRDESLNLSPLFIVELATLKWISYRNYNSFIVETLSNIKLLSTCIGLIFESWPMICLWEESMRL